MGNGNTPQKSVARPFQISLSLMLLLMVVFAFISAALFYAAQVPAIRQEVNVLWYGEARDGGEDVGRIAHRAFILFTFTSPLLLACVLSIAVSVMKYFQRKSS
jgi:magnesium-transporting ATPase (P-type)